MNTLRVCCSCPRCYVPAEEEDSGRRIAPEEAVAHISLFGVSPLLDTPVEDVLARLRSGAPPAQPRALVQGAATGSLAGAPGGQAGAAEATAPRTEQAAGHGGDAGDVRGNEFPAPQPNALHSDSGGAAAGAPGGDGGFTTPSDDAAAGAGLDGDAAHRSTSPDAGGAASGDGGCTADDGLDGDDAVAEVQAYLAHGLLSGEQEQDVEDDLGFAPPPLPPPPPPPPPPPQGAAPPYGGDAWEAEARFRRVLRRGALRLHPDYPATLGEVVCELVALKIDANLSWAQLLLVVEIMRRRLPGGENLPKDLETFKRLLSIGDKEVYTAIDECLDCGFLFYSAKTPEFCELQQCRRCGADRYEITPQGDARPRKTGLILCDNVRQIRLLMRRPEIASALAQHVTERRKDGLMGCAWDADLWEAEETALPELAQRPWHFRTALATDGVQVNRGQNAKPYSCTPFILVLKNLPPNLRHEFNNVIFCAFTKGPSKPGDYQEVLRVVLEVMDLVWTRGVMAYDGAKNEFVLVKAIVRECCVDGMMLPYLLNCFGPGAINGDPWSDDRAMRHPCGRGGLWLGNYRRWLDLGDLRRTDPAYGPPVTAGPPAPKTHQWYMDTGAAMDALLTGVPVTGTVPASVKRAQKSTGVKGSCAFQRNLSYWDALKGTDTAMPPDLMHVIKNVCELLAGQPCEAGNTGFILTAYAGDALDAMAVRLSCVRFPTDVSVKPLEVLLNPNVKPYCNSHEWLLFATSGIVQLAMLGNVPRPHFDAFLKLFDAVSIFTSGVAEHPRCEHSTLTAAHRGVVDALVELERILPTPMLTSQLRRLVYVARFVPKLGPAPEFWAFFAESLYGAIANGNAQRRNPEVAFAAAAMLRAAGSSIYAASNLAQSSPEKPGLCVDELMQFTSHAAQHTLDDDERALFAEAAGAFTIDLGGDIIVSRYTHAMYAGRIPLRTASCDVRSATANSGIMFIHGDEICYGHVRCFDALESGSARIGFVLVDAYCGAESDYVPWLLEPLNWPCVPLQQGGGGPAMEALYINTGDICGRFYFCDGDGAGLPTERGGVRALRRLVPTHYANLMLKRHSARRRRLMMTLLGHANHSADNPLRVQYSGAWPDAPPPRVLHMPEAVESGDDASDGVGGDNTAAQPDLETGEIYQSEAALRRSMQARRGEAEREARRVAAAAAAAARAAAAAHAAAVRQDELVVGQPQLLKRRDTGVHCPSCERPHGDSTCVYRCCSRSCCDKAAAAASAIARAAGAEGGVRACDLYGHARRVPSTALALQARFRPSV